MAQNRVIYSAEDVFVGPAEGDKVSLLPNACLLARLERVKSLSFDIKQARTDIKELGNRGTAGRVFVNPSEVTLDIDYLVSDVRNEARLGLNPFYIISGSTYVTGGYFNNPGGYFSTSLVSGITNDARNLDRRNIFVTINNSGGDIKNTASINVTGITGSFNDYIDQNANSYSLIGFSNAYLTSYRTQAAVNDFISASLRYSCDSMTYWVSGSGNFSPDIDLKSGNFNSRFKNEIPRYYGNNLPTVLNPGDISLDIRPLVYQAPTSATLTTSWAVVATTSLGYSYQLQAATTDRPHNFIDIGAAQDGNGTDITFTDTQTGNRNLSTYRFAAYSASKGNNFGINLNGINVQSYSIGFSIERDAIQVLGYKFPLDRSPIHPIIVDASFSVLVSDFVSGSLLSSLRSSDAYDIKINVRYPGQNAPSGKATALRYDIRGADFEGLNDTSTVGANKIASISFRTELNPDSFDKGLFISGIVPDPIVVYDVIDTESFDRITMEDGSRILSEPMVLGLNTF